MSGSYADNARRLSQRLRDQPESARERAVWWVEYAMRHNGTNHLRPPSADLHWTQSHLLDVAMLGAVAAWLIFLVAAAACRSTWRRKRKIE
jgi:glucuronosyltransferase